MELNKALFSILFILSGISSFSQAEPDSIILLNGRVYRGTITATDNGILRFDETDKKGNTFNSEIADYRIFSFTRGGITSVVYEQDELHDNFLTVEEAKNATLGSYDARQTFKPRFVFWSSLLLGYGASIYDTYLLQKTVDHPDYQGSFTEGGFFRSRPSLFPFFIPVVVSVGWSLPTFRIKENQIIQTHLINNESYYRGYHRVSKQKRMLGALKGSLIGIGAGLITYGVLKP